MKKYRSLIFIVTISCLMAFLIFYFQKNSDLQESITTFPEDARLTYDIADTALSVKPRIQSGRYHLLWQADSKTNEKVYLREDLALLYKDDRLISILSNWRENSQRLNQKKRLTFKEDGRFEAISIHHAEKHRQGKITGKDIMSHDHLSVMVGVNDSVSSFRVPTAPEEQEWQRSRSLIIKNERDAILQQAKKTFDLDLSHYDIFPLTHLHIYQQQTLPGLDKKVTHRAISQLWEGLYKNYLLGIKLKENEIEAPLNSAMPLILYDKKGRNFLVVIKTAKGELALYRQNI